MLLASNLEGKWEITFSQIRVDDLLLDLAQRVIFIDKEMNSLLMKGTKRCDHLRHVPKNIWLAALIWRVRFHIQSVPRPGALRSEGFKEFFESGPSTAGEPKCS